MSPTLTELSAGGGIFFAADPGGGDYTQMIWLLALMVIGAINWLANRMREKREAKDQEEIAKQAREHEREMKQRQYDEPSSVPPPQHQNPPQRSTPPPPPRSTGSEVREFFEALIGQPVTAPPPPPPQQRETPPPPPSKKKSGLSREEEMALKAIQGGESDSKLDRGRTRRNRMHASEQHTALAKMLRDPTSMRNAFILKEILDPPAALKESDSFGPRCGHGG